MLAKLERFGWEVGQAVFMQSDIKLFGLRTDDKRKGGDIDVFFSTNPNV